MALSNTSERYGSVAKTFHWLTALLILTLIPLGFYANQLPYTTSEELALKAWYFSVHKTIGVAAFFVALGRILWALSQPKPGLLNADHKIESFAAEVVHWVLYASLVIVPLSGWISHAAASGYAPIWWPLGQGLPLVPQSTTVEHVVGALHGVAAKVLIASLILHIAGALKHHVVDKDSTLRRMLPGRASLPPLPPQHASATPALSASVLWVGVLGIAGVIALSAEQTSVAAPAPELAEVSSEWQVLEGGINISVVQFGSEVAGSFSDWTAEIAFDDTIDMGKAGTVRTTISIPSLTLGSVTDQAMGADFFDAANHATAVFEADLMHASDGYEAQGTLTIKGNEVPVVLPFTLSVQGDEAQMRGDLALNRLDFGIGQNMPDESSLGFTVNVNVTLKAGRAATS